MNYIELKFRKLLSGKLTGGFRSFFKSSGIELEDFRKYEAGDEPKYINWKLSAKEGELFVKLFKQEKDASLHIFFDININWNAGYSTTNKEKVIDLFSDLVVISKKYGANIITYFPQGNGTHSIPVGKDPIKASKAISTIRTLALSSSGRYSSSLSSFLGIQKKISKSHIVMIFSDFLGIGQEDQRMMKILSEKNELFLIRLNIDDFVGLNFDSFVSQKEFFKDFRLKFLDINKIR